MCTGFGSRVRVPPDILKAVGIHDVCKGRCFLHATHGVNIESVRRVDCIEGVKNAIEVTNNKKEASVSEKVGGDAVEKDVFSVSSLGWSIDAQNGDDGVANESIDA